MALSKALTEAERLIHFSDLLWARSQLLHAGYNLEQARLNKACTAHCEQYVAYYLTDVWEKQQACIDYEMQHPLER